MRTGSNHEYKEHRQAVRMSYLKYYGSLSRVLYREDMPKRNELIRVWADRFCVTETTIKRWLKP